MTVLHETPSGRWPGSVIDQRLFRILMLGLPGLVKGEWIDLIRAYEGNKPPYAVLCGEEMYPLLEAALLPRLIPSPPLSTKI